MAIARSRPRRRRSCSTRRAASTSPHVFGVQVGQPVTIVNSDPTLHNVHAVPKANGEFNFGQAIKGMKTTRMFDKPEVMVPFRCDVHGWMAAYGGVVSHPFFAVSNADGSFEIKGLPAGTYTIEVWHERSARRRRRSRLTARAVRPRTSPSRANRVRGG